MTSLTRLLDESLMRTTPSSGSPNDSGAYVPAETAPLTGVIFHVDFPRDNAPVPPGSVEIDALVAEHESDPIRRAALESARHWVAEVLPSDERNQLRLLRLKKGLSQARLAEIIGTTQAHIARIESGRCDVQVGTLARLAKALGLRPIRVIEAFLTKHQING